MSKTFERTPPKEEPLYKMVLVKNVVIPGCEGIKAGDFFMATDTEAKNHLIMRIAKLAPGGRLPEWLDQFFGR